MERSTELSMDQAFLQSLKEIVLSNLENEQFGAEDLAKEMGLSRSQIHRKLQKINDKSITQFIREIRLDVAVDLLKKEVDTASEIAYKVGFSSPAYFTKCFHEHFGYTPGEAKYSISTSENAPDEDNSSDGTTIVPIHGSKKASTAELTKSIRSRRVLISIASLAVIALVIVLYLKPWSKAESSNDIISADTTNTKKVYSIAVMPFKDMSPDHDMEYLSDGISEEIINMLTKVNGLKVIGRTSSFSFKGKDTDIKTIGEILGVDMVLEGSVMKSGNQLRITVQLINAEDGFHIWSERYDKPFTEILALQDEITQSVVSRINETLASDKGNSYDDKGTDNPEAYENFLKGEFVAKRYYVKWELVDFELAEIYYKNAIVLDSNFALPHLSLTDLYGSRLLGLEFDEDDQLRQKLLDLWIYNLNKGYALDPDNEISNWAKATWFWKNGQNIDIDSAYYYYKKALVINPKNAFILQDFAFFFRLGLGLFEQALLLCNEAIDIDPLNLWALGERVNIYGYFLSNFDKAEADLEEVLKLSGENNNNIIAMFVLNAQKGNQQETMKYLSKMHESPSDETIFAANFPFFCDSVTNALFAKEDKEKLVPNLESNYWIIMPPTIFMSLDMYEEQLDFLEKLVLEKLVSKYPYTSYFPLLSKNPLLEPIRNTPRFQKLLEFSRIRHQELEAKYGNLDFLDL